MSTEAVWDLKASSSPRSLCVFHASSSTSSDAIHHNGTNPFAVASSSSSSPFDSSTTTSTQNNTATQAVVFGTESGSLHYRTFSAPLTSSSSSTSNNNNFKPSTQLPLGIGGRPPSNLPRAFFPVDLSGAFSGTIVSVVCSGDTASSSSLSATSSQQQQQQVFLVLVDDNKGTSAGEGAYAATLVTLQHGSFSKLPTPVPLPRISAATFHPSTGFVFAAARQLQTIPVDELLLESSRSTSTKQRQSGRNKRRIDFSGVTTLPHPGARGGQDALELTADGRVAVLAIGNSVYAVAGTISSGGSSSDGRRTVAPATEDGAALKLISFAQSSQVHPVIILDTKDSSMDPDWSCFFLANGRECAIIDLHHPEGGSLSCGSPRNGVVTLASPILAAAASWPWVAVLTSDGLVSIRSPSCLAISLRTVEVGTRPNDYFILRTLKDQNQPFPWICGISYSGEGKALQCRPDTSQDLADRLMRHAIDAFGTNGFPRSELAEAVEASFTATSYVGPEPNDHSRDLLRQYLEAVLGLAEFEGSSTSGWPTDIKSNTGPSIGGLDHGVFDDAKRSGRGEAPTVVSSATPASLLTGTALLCLVCAQLSPKKASLANRAAKSCATKMGIVVDADELPQAAIRLSELVADRLLVEAGNSSSSSSGSTSSIQRSSQPSPQMEFIEAATWLLRSSGKHEKVISVLYDRLQKHRSPDGSRASGFWSQIKYESYTATHLSELWATGKDEACQLVLHSDATHRLLEHNPRMGLEVFTSNHPRNEARWKDMTVRDDPLCHPSYEYTSQVVNLLKSINPAVPYDRRETGALTSEMDAAILPIESGRALAVTFLESAIGINSGRLPEDEDSVGGLDQDDDFKDRISNFHDELCYLLLEGVITERGDNDKETDTTLGSIYREKLKRFLEWPLAKVRVDKLLASLPESFLQEKALALGMLGKHEDALRILYCDCKSVDLALEYCDRRHQLIEERKEHERTRIHINASPEDRYLESDQKNGNESDCAYLPLVKVALESDEDRERGITAAIQVLAMRRNSVDRAAALRLLPKDVPVSAVARPFLIPALVDSESKIRRLTVVSSLLRSRYIGLKQKLTDAQLQAQSNIGIVPQFQSMNLGEPLHSTKSIQARPSTSASPTFPNVVITKHFFPRHVIIQAKVSNDSPAVDGRALGSVTFVVAESSEDAIQPSLQVPIKVLPYQSTGSTWCVLAASPQRMEGTAILTCELRYSVLAVDATTGAPLSFGGVGNSNTAGRTYIEELQDLEVYSSHFA